MPYSAQAIHQLESIPLIDVMRANGYAVHHRTAKSYFYLCPFHEEKDASFSVTLQPVGGQRYPMFKCFSCTSNPLSTGVGAIALQHHLLIHRKERKQSRKDACDVLAKLFNLFIDGDYKNGWQHRNELVDAQPHATFEVRTEWTHAELRALGCQVHQLYTHSGKEKHTGEATDLARTDAEGTPQYRYSFGRDFYAKDCAGNNFDPRLISERFGIYPLASFTFPAKKDRDGIGMHSRRVKSTDAYPLFILKYEDEQGWWAKKYEPLFREERDEQGKSKGNYKFTWWYQDGQVRTDLDGCVYGDVDVMRALKDGIVRSSDDAHPAHNFTVHDGQETYTRYQFDKLIICSGPRDAINVYFHSDAHVVYPHSESTEIPDATLRRLFDIAHEVYVLYDIDKTGIEQMHRLAFRNLHLHVIYLPDDLRTEHNPRTGRPCKDAEEFFNFYPAVMRRDEKQQGISINKRFRGLVRNALWMQFWGNRYSQPKGADGNKGDVIPKYKLDFVCMAQFLAANGFYKYVDEKGTEKFITVRNNIVDIIDSEEAMVAAKAILIEFLDLHDEYSTKDLKNAILTQRTVTKDSLKSIKSIDLNFVSWGKDYEYFFFRNTAVRVTADEIKCVAYKDLPCHVNRKAIMDYDYHPVGRPLFTIEEDKGYQAAKELYEERMADERYSDSEKKKFTTDFSTYERLWRFNLAFSAPQEQLPPTLQFLYDTSRIHWRKEAQGFTLNKEEQQWQDMHFVCKVAAMGYVLSRYRTGMMQKFSVLTDYNIIDGGGKANGGSGKTIIQSLFEQVRRVCSIAGKGFKRKENMSKNFQEFRDTEHGIVFIDDLREDIMGSEFYNITERITVKTLYNNEVTLPKERTPKMFITTNRADSFNIAEPSTLRRLFIGLASDYYHPAGYHGDIRPMSPGIKFGKDIIQDATPEERNYTAHLMMQCCQFYIGHQVDMLPPTKVGEDDPFGDAQIKLRLFNKWARRFFQNPWRMGRPLSNKEISLSYLDYVGEPLTEQSVKSKVNEVMDDLTAYCHKAHIEMNPTIVKRKDNTANYPRRKVWETTYDLKGNANLGMPRKRSENSVNTCYFYRQGEVPQTMKEVLNDEVLRDEEMLWEAKREEEED